MGQIKKGTSPSVVAIHRCDPEARKETLGGVLHCGHTHPQNAGAVGDRAVSREAQLILDEHRKAIKKFGTLATILSDNGSCFVQLSEMYPKSEIR